MRLQYNLGQVEEIPAAISQGRTIQELKDNLLDAIKLVLDANREIVEKEHTGKTTFTEELILN